MCSCSNTYLQISDGKSDRKYCGTISNSEDYAFTACSGKVEITYVTSSTQNSDFRGFRIYFECMPKY